MLYPARSYDYPTGIALDKATNIFICGTSHTEGSNYMMTLKFAQVPSMRTSVQDLMFDSVAIGGIQAETLWLANTGSVPIAVTSVLSELQDFQVSIPVDTIWGFDSVLCVVQFSPLVPGQRSTIVEIGSSAINTPVTVALNGIGTGEGSGVHIDVQLGIGWQLISTPVQTEDPIAMNGLFAYSAGYSRSVTMAPGLGYWRKMTDSVLGFSGYPLTQQVIHVSASWNMIGGLSYPVSAHSITSSPPGIVASSFFFFGPHGYEAADSIRPGHGYWVQVSQTGRLFLNASTPPAAPMTREGVTK